MSSIVVHDSHSAQGSVPRGIPIVLAALLVASGSAFLAGWLPLGFSIVTVFLFAGPHNWIEARYFLTRLPARWGKLRPFFLTAFLGIFGLSLGFAALTWMAQSAAWTSEHFFLATALWNSALVLWVMALIQMRSRQNPRRDWFWTVPIGFIVLALAWLDPYVWSLGLVYAHPLMAFWILDRELKRSRPELRPLFHKCLPLVPLLLGLLWLRLGQAPNLPGEDALTVRITQHAGAGILNGISTHFLVAAHTFLEMLHYGIWLIVIPLVAFRAAPWQVKEVPLARRSPLWHRAVLAILILGGLTCLILWGCFLANYPITRDIYFTVALLHVLAEVPFLLRAL